MNISLLIVSMVLTLGGPQTPNFYSGYSSARDASRKSGKEMLIFFSRDNCDNCEAAWMAYSKDAPATQQYVSTRMDIDDFDGGVFYDMLDLGQFPAWIVFNADGTEKERWSGGWKDAKGEPTVFDLTVIKSTPVPAKTSAPASPIKTAAHTSTKELDKSVQTTESVRQDTPGAKHNTEGYILQAGYFGSEENARKMQASLAGKGFNNFRILPHLANGTQFYRVASEPFAAEQLAQQENTRLTNAGFKASIKNQNEL